MCLSDRLLNLHALLASASFCEMAAEGDILC